MKAITRFVLRMTVAIAWSASFAACSNPSANVDYIPTGQVAVVIHDQSGAGVSGAHVQILDLTSSFVWTEGTSTSNGTVAFSSGSPPGGLIGGSYRASVTAPAGYVIAAGQANPVTFKISDKTTTTLNVTVTRSP